MVSAGSFVEQVGRDVKCSVRSASCSCDVLKFTANYFLEICCVRFGYPKPKVARCQKRCLVGTLLRADVQLLTGSDSSESKENYTLHLLGRCPFPSFRSSFSIPNFLKTTSLFYRFLRFSYKMLYF